MLTYNMDVTPESVWKRTTPSEAELTQPYYCTEAGVFYAQQHFSTARTDKESYILFYTLRGAGLIEQDGTHVTLSTGQALLLNCRTPQSYCTAPGQSCWHHYWVHLDIVTGGSSGIGRCTASALKENGCIVYEFSRRNIPMEGVTHLSVDVTDEDAVNAAVQQVIQKETKIDAVVNCAGFGISGAVEFTSMEQAKAQFDVNFFGTVTVNKAVLPFLRRQGKGHIVNISSVAAVAHIPFQTFYSASKAAVSSYSYALANEVKPYGIHVTVVELGDICTGFTKARQKSILGDDEYGGRISRSVSQMEHDEQNGMDPARIGRYIAGIVKKKKPAVVYVAGAQYKFLSLLCKLLPAAARGKIVGKIYG